MLAKIEILCKTELEVAAEGVNNKYFIEYSVASDRPDWKILS